MIQVKKDSRMLLHVTRKCVQLGVNGANGQVALSHVVMVVRHLEHVRVNLVPTVRVPILKRWAVKLNSSVLVRSNGQTGLIVRSHVVMDVRNENENVLSRDHVKTLKWMKQENVIWQIAHVWVNGQNGLLVMSRAVMESN